jgi:acetyltransferase-like isoleucine patch superfamily enzyme
MRSMTRFKLFRNRVRRKLFRLPEEPLYTKDFLGDRFQIGDHTYGRPKVVSRGEGASLKIGKYCSIATRVTIFLGSEHRVDWVSTYPFSFLWEEAKTIQGHPATKGDVVIGNDVWIGHGVTILSGVSVGDGAAIGACSLVTKDIPSYAIVAGNPAQIVRYRFQEETVKALLKIRWWDWPDQKVRDHIHSICSPSVDKFVRTLGQ